MVDQATVFQEPACLGRTCARPRGPQRSKIPVGVSGLARARRLYMRNEAWGRTGRLDSMHGDRRVAAAVARH